MRGVSERTVQRDWEKARILLQRALEGRELLPTDVRMSGSGTRLRSIGLSNE